jgi:hypothetical protein
VISAARAIGIFCVGLAAGCAGIDSAPPRVAANAEPAATVTISAAPSADATVVSGTVPVDVVAAAPPVTVPTVKPVVVPATPAKIETTAKEAAPPVRAPAKAVASIVAVEQPRKSPDPAPIAKAPESTLDVAGLTARLRDTKAIGVFTKLALKNQVDDLLKQFRAHYQSGQKTGVASLRPPYDMLVLKVLALVQDGDPSLARTISGSREAIWGILADPEKFNSIAVLEELHSENT